MNVAELFGQGRPVFSCEVFPPKKTSPVDTIYQTLDGIQHIRPDFISVTFGAGGTDANQATRKIASIIQNQYKIPAVAHLTCLNLSNSEIYTLLDELEGDGITHVLAMRGDHNPDVPAKTDFTYASQLVELVHRRGGFGIAGACYPEGHLESQNLITDTRHLKAKVDAGAEHLISQLFFDNDDFYRFLERCQIAGIEVPIQAGIMPVLSRSSIERMVSLCGSSLPRKLTRILADMATIQRH